MRSENLSAYSDCTVAASSAPAEDSAMPAVAESDERVAQGSSQARPQRHTLRRIRARSCWRGCRSSVAVACGTLACVVRRHSVNGAAVGNVAPEVDSGFCTRGCGGHGRCWRNTCFCFVGWEGDACDVRATAVGTESPSSSSAAHGSAGSGAVDDDGLSFPAKAPGAVVDVLTSGSQWADALSAVSEAARAIDGADDGVTGGGGGGSNKAALAAADVGRKDSSGPAEELRASPSNSTPRQVALPQPQLPPPQPQLPPPQPQLPLPQPLVVAASSSAAVVSPLRHRVSAAHVAPPRSAVPAALAAAGADLTHRAEGDTLHADDNDPLCAGNNCNGRGTCRLGNCVCLPTCVRTTVSTDGTLTQTHARTHARSCRRPNAIG
jgi:hypothetical protein